MFKDWSQFLEFVDFINNATDIGFESGFEGIFHLDEYLRIVAIDVFINNWDSHLEQGRNWYLYHEPKSNKYIGCHGIITIPLTEEPMDLKINL